MTVDLNILNFNFPVRWLVFQIFSNLLWVVFAFPKVALMSSDPLHLPTGWLISQVLKTFYIFYVLTIYPHFLLITSCMQPVSFLLLLKLSTLFGRCSSSREVSHDWFETLAETTEINKRTLPTQLELQAYESCYSFGLLWIFSLVLEITVTSSHSVWTTISIWHHLLAFNMLQSATSTN